METLVQLFIKAFGWSIINSLWQSAVIYGILFIIMLSLPKLPARYKHNLAFGAIVTMFAGFAYNFIHQMVLSVKQDSVNIDIQSIQAYQYFNNLPPTFSNKAEQYFPVIVAFYIIGILLQLFVIIKGYRQLSKLKTDSLSLIPENWKSIFSEVTTKLKINKLVQFHLSSLVNVPLVIGYLKPIVLFPVALVNQLDEEQVEAILIHELSHIRRNDYLLNLIKTAIETLLFYNPFVWMAGRFIHIEREHACDDLVLKFTGKPLNYAHALLKLELIKDKNSPAYALAATGKTQNLYQRIKRITNMKTNYLNVKQQMAALTLGVACLFSIAWINPAEKKKEAKKTISTTAISNHLATAQLQDTSRKRKVQIITIDKNGKRTEYNSLKEMPDSLRKNFDEEIFSENSVFKIKMDSPFKFKDSLLQTKIYKQFHSPEAQAKWKKFGEDVAKQYSSPEAQAKWKKFGEDVAKQYSSPEAQAKWKKFGEDIAKQYSSPEAQAKWQKFAEDIAKEYSSPEAQAKWQKFGEDIAKEYTSGEGLYQMDQMNDLIAAAPNNDRKKRLNLYTSENFAKLKNLKGLKPDTAFGNNARIYTLTDGNDNVILYSDESQKLKNSEEYKKLKEKFNKDVKELKKKMEKTEKKERKEKTEN